MKLSSILSICLLTQVLIAGYGKFGYPYGNPVITDFYTADAAPQIMPDGQVWMVTSTDSMEGGGYQTMAEYTLFSSSDMRNWKSYGTVLNVDDVRPEGVDLSKEFWALWAPDMIYHNGKYYLYYPVWKGKTDPNNPDGKAKRTESYIGVAWTDTLGEPFKVINPKIEGTSGIDPAVFIDDDGTAYLYWGNQMAAKLKDNMYELDSKPVRLDLDTDKFMEAIWMHKYEDKYYISYHTKYDWNITLSDDNINCDERKTSDLAYSVGDNPMGPFEYGGILNYEPGVNVECDVKHPDGDFVPWRLTLSNHGGVVEYHGRHYLFYHTSALSSWIQTKFQDRGTWTQRSVCIDEFSYTPQGDIIPVTQTITGPEKIEVNQPFEILHKEVTLDSGMGKLSGIDFGSGYYYFDALIEAPKEGLLEIRLGSPDGHLVGTCRINPEMAKNRNGLIETFIRGAKGVNDVFFLYKSDMDICDSLTLANPRFFAGSPLVDNN